MLRPDVMIRVDDVPAGKYRAKLRLRVTPARSPGTEARTASTSRPFTIPEIPGGRSDEPFELGDLKPEPEPNVRPSGEGGGL
jgi:hypothetical protein